MEKKAVSGEYDKAEKKKSSRSRKPPHRLIDDQAREVKEKASAKEESVSLKKRKAAMR